MNPELKTLAAERIETDYSGCVEDFWERGIGIKGGANGLRVDKIEYKNNQFHYYHISAIIEFGPQRGPRYTEIFPTDEEEEKILDEFYAWY